MRVSFAKLAVKHVDTNGRVRQFLKRARCKVKPSFMCNECHNGKCNYCLDIVRMSFGFDPSCPCQKKGHVDANPYLRDLRRRDNEAGVDVQASMGPLERRNQPEYIQEQL